jgi:flagellar FliL protein
MISKWLKTLTLVFALAAAPFSFAEEEKSGPLFSYYTLEPELTTNFHTGGDKLGYIRVRIDIMVAHESYLPELETHDPLIRDAAIELLGKQDESVIKSLAGREELRKKLIDELNSILLAETGKTLISDLLFTKYLYQ